MGAITGTLAKRTELGGEYKVFVFTSTIAAASDTIDLSAYVTEIVGASAHLTAGMDADCQTLQTSYSGTTVTVVSKNAAGSAATDFTGTTIEVLVIGKYN
jgi:hypothetical protein